MEITNELSVSAEQIASLEMHSVINILSVISGQLQLIQMETDHDDLFNPPVEKCKTLAAACSSKEKKVLTLESIRELRKSVFSALDELENRNSVLNDGSSVSEHRENLVNIFNVFDVRMMEILHRWESPGAWEAFNVNSFIGDFKKFFYAMEKNSNGRYKIIYNIADQEEKDYLVHFAINSDGNKNRIYLPLMLKDVIRDLIANARKYTPPGGELNIGISQKNNLFKFVIEDNGMGIPEDEITKVVEYGTRGSNVKDKVRTMGGGFGLTKAYFVVKELDGRMWIESELNQGTKITIEIPIPNQVYQKYD
ncbi:MAG: ATP-binding protein [Balneolaceae bacterium]|nr:ATP-binding protein [Balneolaceae bacterium]